jgi:hypothetical protein
MRWALLKTGLMAEAVLTPRYKDLEAGTWTTSRTAHRNENITQRGWEKQKCNLALRNFLSKSK